MLELLLTGVILGLSAGFAPGPLLSLVISETLQHGVGAGIRVALAPLVTDLPIILLTIFLLHQLAGLNQILGAISLAGAAFLFHMAWDTLCTTGIPDQTDRPRSGSLARGVLTNLLSPHPYLFWLSVGGAYLTKEPGFVAPALFLVGFYACLVGAKVLLAISVGRSRAFLSRTLLKWIFRVLGVLLGILAIGLLFEGLTLIGILGQS